MSERLRPMAPGEVLDQTFRLYRRHFLTFLCTATPACVLWYLFETFALSAMKLDSSETAFIVRIGLEIAAMTWAACLPLTWIAGGRWLSRPNRPMASIASAFGRLLRRTVSAATAIAVFLLGGLCGFLLMSLMSAIESRFPSFPFNSPLRALNDIFSLLAGTAGFGLLVWSLISPMLVLPASMLEDLGPIATVRRGFHLLRGAQRTLVFLLAAGAAIHIVAWGLVNLPLEIVYAILSSREGGVTVYLRLQSAVQNLAFAFSLPIPSIGLALTYYNQRVIREGYDIQALLAELPPAAGTNVSGLK